MKPSIIVISASLLTLGCATKSKSIVTGALIGAAGGAVVGNQTNGHKPEKHIAGALIGAGIGALIGYSHHNHKNKKADIEKKAKSVSEFAPLLKKPKVKMYWVPHQIKGKKFIERHRVWELDAEATWSKD